jgi:hypothetical protein
MLLALVIGKVEVSTREVVLWRGGIGGCRATVSEGYEREVLSSCDVCGDGFGGWCLGADE